MTLSLKPFRFPILILLVLLTIAIVGNLTAARAQGHLSWPKVRTVPTSCNPVADPAIFKTPASSGDTASGIFVCDPATNTYAQLAPHVGSLTPKTFIYANATPAIASTAAPTNGQLLIGNTGNNPTLGTPLGTANEILATLGAGTLQFGLATTVIHKGGTNFQFTDTSDTTKKFTFDASGITTGTTRSLAVPDLDGILTLTTGSQIINQKILIFGGVASNKLAHNTDNTKQAIFDLSNITTATIRTINVPDANTTTTQALTAVDSVVVTGVSGTTGIFTTGTAEVRLNTVAAVDMNTATPTVLYTSPSGRSTIITRVIVHACSTSMTTASYSYGWTSAAFSDVIANATHTELTGATLYTSLSPKTGALVGTSTQTFNVLMNTLQGGAATCRMSVFGYTF